ncbi:three component ABC system middle component [Pseudomonas phoenicis]|uniref:three component ABC system middle component n=1 Tax=unclassified Pseudomonas TaxID=196821 RepID=UPI00399F13D8
MEASTRRSTQDPSEDIYLVQNPALGAALVWRFVEAYAPKAAGKLPVLPLLFLVLPIVYRKELRDVAVSTQISSGLRLFAGKFKKEQEVLYGIQSRMLRLKKLSLSSISIALHCGLISINTESAEISSLRQKAPKHDDDDIKHMMRTAEKLGHWCKELTLPEVQAILRIKL